MGECIRSRVDLARVFKANAPKPYQEILRPVVRAECRSRPTPSTMLDPEVVFWLMVWVVNSTEGTMKSAAASFARVVGPDRPSDKDDPFTAAAFSKARARVDPSLFKRIFDRFVQRFHDRFGERFRWKGFHLMGIDGTMLNLPANAPELLSKFPCSSGGKARGIHPQILLVALVDLWTGVVRDFAAIPKERGQSENSAAQELVESLGTTDLLLGDANFPAYDLCCWTRKRGAHFLFRCSAWRFSAASYKRTFFENPAEYLMELTLPRQVGTRNPDLPTTLTIRVLEHQLPNGQLLRLVTSLLDPVAYPYEELIKLYLERWHQETSHREWKHTLKLSNLRSRKAPGIQQEIQIQLTLNNALRWVQADAISPAPKEEEPRAPVHLRYRDTLRILQTAATDARHLRSSDLAGLYVEVVDKVSRLWIKKRPGRSYPRTKPGILERRHGVATRADLTDHAHS